jgi:uncharacterized membrane protein YgcG
MVAAGDSDMKHGDAQEHRCATWVRAPSARFLYDFSLKWFIYNLSFEFGTAQLQINHILRVCICNVCQKARTEVELGAAQLARLGLQLPLLLPQPAAYTPSTTPIMTYIIIYMIICIYLYIYVRFHGSPPPPQLLHQPRRPQPEQPPLPRPARRSSSSAAASAGSGGGGGGGGGGGEQGQGGAGDGVEPRPQVLRLRLLGRHLPAPPSILVKILTFVCPCSTKH